MTKHNQFGNNKITINNTNKKQSNMETKTISVTRNNTPWPYTYGQLKRKSPTDAIRFAFVPVAVNEKNPELTSEVFMNHLGDDAIPMLEKQVRGKAAFCSKIAEAEASSKDEKGEVIPGTVDVAKMTEYFEKYIQDFSVRGETLKSLQEEKQDLVDSITELVGATDITPEEKMAKLSQLASRIKEIESVIEERQSRNQQD